MVHQFTFDLPSTPTGAGHATPKSTWVGSFPGRSASLASIEEEIPYDLLEQSAAQLSLKFNANEFTPWKAASMDSHDGMGWGVDAESEEVDEAAIHAELRKLMLDENGDVLLVEDPLDESVEEEEELPSTDEESDTFDSSSSASSAVSTPPDSPPNSIRRLNTHRSNSTCLEERVNAQLSTRSWSDIARTPKSIQPALSLSKEPELKPISEASRTRRLRYTSSSSSRVTPFPVPTVVTTPVAKSQTQSAPLQQSSPPGFERPASLPLGFEKPSSLPPGFERSPSLPPGFERSPSLPPGFERSPSLSPGLTPTASSLPMPNMHRRNSSVQKLHSLARTGSVDDFERELSRFLVDSAVPHANVDDTNNILGMLHL